MATLQQIRVKDFRAYREESVIDFPDHGLVLIAGPNNSGKSALLSALDVVATGSTPNAVRHAEGKQAVICARFKLRDDERIAMVGSSAKALAQIERGAVSWLEWAFDDIANGQMKATSCRAAWMDDEQIDLMKTMPIDAQRAIPVQVPHLPLSEWDRTTFKNSATYREIVPGSVFENLELLEWVDPSARVMLPAWRGGYFHFNPLHQSVGESRQANAVERLSPDGSNLIDVLHDMKSNREPVWQELQQLIKEFVPGVGTLQLPAYGTHLQAAFHDDAVPGNFMHNLRNLGTGVDQLLMTFVVGLTQTATTVVLEEPETGLHPAAQRALLGLLQDWSKDRLIVAATHSSTMLDWTSPSTKIISVSRSGANSTAVPVSQERSQALGLLRELGVRPSDVLTADRVLIIEGPTEKEVLDVWFQEDMRSPRLALLHGEGGYNARHAELFANWLDGIDALGQRKVLYMRDRDELSASFVEKLEKSERVKLLPCREFENLLLDFNAVAAVINNERTEGGRTRVTSAALEAKARATADGLKNLVILKRTMADFADPLRYVDNKSRSKLTKEGTWTAEAVAESIVGVVPDKAALKQKVHDAWAAHEADVNATWEGKWQELAPGDEILNGIFKDYLNRNYSKVDDGPRIAREMNPPTYLVELLAAFMAS